LHLKAAVAGVEETAWFPPPEFDKGYSGVDTLIVHTLKVGST
jgi:hypothetical protein